MAMPGLLVGGRRRTFALLVANGLAQGTLAVFGAWLIMRLFDRLGQGEPLPALLFAALLASLPVSALLRRYERIHAERLGQDYVRAVRLRLYGRLLRSDPRQLARRRLGGVVLRFVGDLSALRQWVSLGLARLLIAGLSLGVVLAALGWLYWPFAVGVGLVLAAAAAWVVRQSRRLHQAIGEARRRQAQLAANVSEKLANLTTVQAFGQARRERRQMLRQSNRLFDAAIARAARIGTLRALIDATAGAAVATILGIAFLGPAHQLSLGAIAGVMSLVGFLTPPLRDLGRAQEYWLAAHVAMAKIHDLERSTRRLPTNSGGPALRIGHGELCFARVSVAGALENVTATAPGGARVAVVGANGSGKSTLLGLAGRLFAPDAGAVRIDGVDLAGIDLRTLRRQVAYVSPDTPLLRGSLERNLFYGAAPVDPAWRDRLLRACGIDELAAEAPEGLQRRVAEGGANLSQGQRVRVALARALLVQPKILLLDEPDANLDAPAIRALDQVIDDFPGTLLIATHRLAVLQRCQWVWHLHQGRLVAAGSPQRLLQEAGPTRVLFDVEAVSGFS